MWNNRYRKSAGEAEYGGGKQIRATTGVRVGDWVQERGGLAAAVAM